ncbi:hypothetical protein CEXT_294051 [Caerostris extrusa]|uniref:Uncharacterized protein n=1 Tax=Caerostris extrusa TaxID=172846 RepID=A0AAV4XUM1_CAEEX|nr:hypothetical protein CEXT_294051 [Caerostris extrusa]
MAFLSGSYSKRCYGFSTGSCYLRLWDKESAYNPSLYAELLVKWNCPQALLPYECMIYFSGYNIALYIIITNDATAICDDDATAVMMMAKVVAVVSMLYTFQ